MTIVVRLPILHFLDHDIRVNAVAPGLVDTASNIATMKPKDLKRGAKREDVAETVVFLASPSRFWHYRPSHCGNRLGIVTDEVSQ